MKTKSALALVTLVCATSSSVTWATARRSIQSDLDAVAYNYVYSELGGQIEQAIFLLDRIRHYQVVRTYGEQPPGEQPRGEQARGEQPPEE